MKSVTVLGLFMVLMASATVYSTYRRALADTNTVLEEPECTIYFDPDQPDISIGEIFTVTVKVDDVKNLWGYEVGLKYDRSVIEYVGAKTPHWKFISGQIEHLFWVAGTEPRDGDVELLQFTFKGRSEGSSSLGFYVHKLATLKYLDAPKDFVGWPIAHELSEGLVSVS
jgi:hypothetical protein